MLATMLDRIAGVRDGGNGRIDVRNHGPVVLSYEAPIRHCCIHASLSRSISHLNSVSTAGMLAVGSSSALRPSKAW